MVKRDFSPLFVAVDVSFYRFYRDVYPVRQKDKSHIRKRKTPVVGDILQSGSYEDLIKDFDECFYNEVFK